MKKLACRLGRHQWTTRVEGGQSFEVCAVCGKTRPDPEPEKQRLNPLGDDGELPNATLPPFGGPSP